MKNLILTIAILIVLSFNSLAQTYGDSTLAQVREQDRTSRDLKGKLNTLSAAEHAFRADVYSTNRVFKEAREHWQKLIDNYPNDPNLPKVYLGMGRSFMWEREYTLAITFFDDAIKDRGAILCVQGAGRNPGAYFAVCLPSADGFLEGANR